MSHTMAPMIVATMLGAMSKAAAVPTADTRDEWGVAEKRLNLMNFFMTYKRNEVANPLHL